ncbi:alpha-amylase [Streptomyces sp. CNQ085]|uniref:alpha-amylase n=1 Tax=Streptomyces sp. CNQ085 TaxID=2886944 RepID=UPI001F504DF9|nr:alpha-amylase [Streptomyces sp. CNQ085]MCI0384222.1 alpha-amylase [Streptomyces sp. CNQ085]
MRGLAERAAAGTGEAPACLAPAPGRRHSFVTNGCAGARTVRVVQAGGTHSPCRTVEPRTTATFAGYGPDDGHPVRIDLCEP